MKAFLIRNSDHIVSFLWWSLGAIVIFVLSELCLDFSYCESLVNSSEEIELVFTYGAILMGFIMFVVLAFGDLLKIMRDELDRLKQNPEQSR